MTQQEFNDRCNKVFISREGDEYYGITEICGEVEIEMSEIGDDGKRVSFPYCPDMSQRPHALAYLMGERNDFDD